jgi:hypothetical protein
MEAGQAKTDPIIRRLDMANFVYKCKACGKEFTGGRKLGDHYGEFPDHRPVGRPRADRPAGGAPARTPRRNLSATDHIQAAIDKLAVEINAKRQMLADVERIKADITDMENRRSALQKMMPPAKPA